MDADSLQTVLTKLGSQKIRPINSGLRLQANCPVSRWLHQSGTDRHPSFTVTVDPKGKSWCTCFTCSLGGARSLEDVVRKAVELGGGFEELLKEVESQEKVSWRNRHEKLELANRKYKFEFQDPVQQKIKRETMDEKVLDQFEREIHPYVLTRKISVEVAKKSGLRWDKRLQRIVFPIRDEKGRLVGMQGRCLDDKANPPKFYNYPGLNKSKWVYNLHNVHSDGPIILTEGVIDALVWTSYGIANVVSTLGSTPSDEQIWRVGKRGQPVFLAFDGDAAGQKAEPIVIGGLLGKVAVYRLSIPQGKDPDDLTPEQALGVIRDRRLVKNLTRQISGI